MSAESVPPAAAATTGAISPALNAEEQRIWVGLLGALARGEPLTYAEVAEEAGAAEARVRRFLDETLGSGWRHVDAEGRVVGFGGLSIEAVTPHEIQVDGRALHAWCAWDTLFLPRILDRPAEVRSVCPVTGQLVELHVTPEHLVRADPAGAVLSFLRADPARIRENVFGSFCRHVHFLASEAAGRKWQAEHPESELLSLEEGFALGREMVHRTCLSRDPTSGRACCGSSGASE